MPQQRVVRSVTIADRQGLHVRQAVECARAAARFQCQIILVHGERRAENCRSPFDILQLGAGYGAEVTIEAIGSDAQEAVEEIATILSREFPN
ncbi:MAG: HPr family phosphocarrier protein [Gemmatales bacterium]|nr:HPr family phosphocarrier protein [Gemmatales bacterium]MCS7161168.1 HPr family phosphocarrier protein [Gemmatales bacterium]MDW8176371.1 HPr family phosphocarrier protein [Gemmatales bacterium]MDW8221685.1 HPr family phosphocarrier protein [Gemmatales bacterium]